MYSGRHSVKPSFECVTVAFVVNLATAAERSIKSSKGINYFYDERPLVSPRPVLSGDEVHTGRYDGGIGKDYP